MKKNLILAVAAVIATGSVAHANKPGGKEGKTEGVKAEATREAKKGATEAAGKGADAAKASVYAEAVKVLRTRMDAGRDANFKALLKTQAGEALVKEIIEMSKNVDLAELAAARMEGLSNLTPDMLGKTLDVISGLNASAKAEQAYVTIIVEAGRASSGWSKDLRETMTFVLKAANTEIANGKTTADAMNSALELAKKPKVDGGRGIAKSTTVDEINKLCKK